VRNTHRILDLWFPQWPVRVLWVGMPCSLQKAQHFGGTYRLNLQPRRLLYSSYKMLWGKCLGTSPLRTFRRRGEGMIKMAPRKTCCEYGKQLQMIQDCVLLQVLAYCSHSVNYFCTLHLCSPILPNQSIIIRWFSTLELSCFFWQHLQ
jgi:hypothetical protein